jgi:hypothetical protein
MTRDELRREREKETRKLDTQFQKLVKTVQGVLWSGVVDIILNLDTDEDGRVKNTIRNNTRITSVGFRIAQTSAQQKESLISRVIKGVTKILGLNGRYFKAEQPNRPETLDERVQRLVMANLGFDTRNNTVIPGGWLDQLADFNPIAQQVGREIRSAIAGKVPINDFRRQFQRAFTGVDGFGYLERHYNTFVFDLYQQVDRQTQFQYAEELGYDHALYSGTIKDNTRPFCRQRVRNIYTRDEIKKWKDLNFQGKLKVGYNPFIHCGGYNCRHHLSWISAESVARLRKEVNNYN